MKLILAVLFLAAVASAHILTTDTPAVARAKLDQFFRSSYEASRKIYRTPTLSYDEARVFAPAMMDHFARHTYETSRQSYMATRKAHEAQALSYDDALAVARSV